jgi:riboflavin synthase
VFTGIIEGLGTIRAIRSSGPGRRFSIEADFPLNETKIGDSISVSGACLTAVQIAGRRFEVDVSPETLQKTTFGKAIVGERVNLERAMRLSDRLDGHLVSGHIDDIGILKQRDPLGNAFVITIEVPEFLTRYMITKGSVAVDGISLTINTCGTTSFTVSIIPYTAKWTTIGFKSIGSLVNLETDMIGKYVERFMAGMLPANKEQRSEQGIIDKEFLLKTGFID